MYNKCHTNLRINLPSEFGRKHCICWSDSIYAVVMKRHYSYRFQKRLLQNQFKHSALLLQLLPIPRLTCSTHVSTDTYSRKPFVITTQTTENTPYGHEFPYTAQKILGHEIVVDM